MFMEHIMIKNNRFGKQIFEPRRLPAPGGSGAGVSACLPAKAGIHAPGRTFLPPSAAPQAGTPAPLEVYGPLPSCAQRPHCQRRGGSAVFDPELLEDLLQMLVHRA